MEEREFALFESIKRNKSLNRGKTHGIMAGQHQEQRTKWKDVSSACRGLHSSMRSGEKILADAGC